MAEKFWEINLVQFWSQSMKPWQRDLVIILGLWMINPIFYGYRSPASLTPDAVSYLTLAQNIFSSGTLVLKSWSHVDTNLILPPLLPAILALTNLVSTNAIQNGEWISAACMILSGVPIYLFVKHVSNRFFAAAAVVLFQTNLANIYFSSYILTEPLFLLLLLFILLLTVKLTCAGEQNYRRVLVLGLLAGLLFLLRQIGIVVLGFLIFWFLLSAVWGWSIHRGRAFFSLAVVVGIWSLIVGSYAAALYQQAGVSPFQQWYRVYNYVVVSKDDAIVTEIKLLNSTEDNNYADVYKKRRDLRKLLPDGTEMYSHVLDSNNRQIGDFSNARTNPIKMALLRMASPTRWLSDCISNLAYLQRALGWVILILTGISFVTPFLLRSSKIDVRARLIVPGFMVAYVLGISLLTSAVERYLIVLYPLAIMQLVGELGVAYENWRIRYQHTKAQVAVFLMVFCVLFALMPLKFSQASSEPHAANSTELWTKFGQFVKAREPIFALLPAYSYYAGGWYRTLPNDSLEKVVEYAHHTGVKWLIIPKHPEHSGEVQLYTSATWLLKPQELRKYPHLVRLRYEQEDNSSLNGDEQLLYEIM